METIYDQLIRAKGGPVKLPLSNEEMVSLGYDPRFLPSIPRVNELCRFILLSWNEGNCLYLDLLELGLVNQTELNLARKLTVRFYGNQAILNHCL